MTVSKTDLRVLADVDVLASLRALRQKQPVKFAAFYSSQLGGVVTDPALMVIPFDDHIVHRGHGIFDTAGIVNGRIYATDNASPSQLWVFQLDGAFKSGFE